jgi:hypothetical protein
MQGINLYHLVITIGINFSFICKMYLYESLQFLNRTSLVFWLINTRNRLPIYDDTAVYDCIYSVLSLNVVKLVHFRTDIWNRTTTNTKHLVQTTRCHIPKDRNLDLHAFRHEPNNTVMPTACVFLTNRSPKPRGNKAEELHPFIYGPRKQWTPDRINAKNQAHEMHVPQHSIHTL